MCAQGQIHNIFPVAAREWNGDFKGGALKKYVDMLANLIINIYLWYLLGKALNKDIQAKIHYIMEQVKHLK